MAKNRNFEVTSYENWGNKLIAYIRVLDKEYRYEIPFSGWAKKLLEKKWFIARDLEKIENVAISYERTA